MGGTRHPLAWPVLAGALLGPAGCATPAPLPFRPADEAFVVGERAEETVVDAVAAVVGPGAQVRRQEGDAGSFTVVDAPGSPPPLQVILKPDPKVPGDIIIRVFAPTPAAARQTVQDILARLGA